MTKTLNGSEQTEANCQTELNSTLNFGGIRTHFQLDLWNEWNLSWRTHFREGELDVFSFNLFVLWLPSIREYRHLPKANQRLCVNILMNSHSFEHKQKVPKKFRFIVVAFVKIVCFQCAFLLDSFFENTQSWAGFAQTLLAASSLQPLLTHSLFFKLYLIIPIECVQFDTGTRTPSTKNLEECISHFHALNHRGRLFSTMMP